MTGKHNVVFVFLFSAYLAVSGPAVAEDSASYATVPEPFRGHDEASEQMVNYDALTELLGTVVFDVGSSRRVFAATPPEITGTRLKPRVTDTANEANRFLFEAFRENEEGRVFLREIQGNLERLPLESPLENFSRDEQLAYWLNLYNVAVLNQVIEVYPRGNLKRLFRGRNSIFSKKLLNVAGVPLSLDDIQFRILKDNYDGNPLVIYGLYQGIIGGPNIRRIAYYGADVWYALEDNATRFINSNRGTQNGDELTFRASSFYERNRVYFPDFEMDLALHLLEFLDGDERDQLMAANALYANIDDWTVTDMGGTRHKVGGSLAHNNAALMDSFRSNNASSIGGVLTAAVEVQWKKDLKPKEPPPDINTDFGTAPVESSDTEGISDGNAER